MSNPRGFALPSAIFLLVILLALGAFMLRVSNIQHLTATQDLQGVRAYRAAQMGLQWAAATLCGPNPGCTAPLVACPAIPVPLGVAPDGFPVVVTCVVNIYNEAGPAGDIVRPVFWITSTAAGGGAVGGIGYTERSLNALIEFPQ